MMKNKNDQDQYQESDLADNAQDSCADSMDCQSDEKQSAQDKSSFQQDQCDRLTEEVAAWKNQCLLAQAELSNVQKRHQEEIKKTRDYCISKFATDLLVVKDYLEMALKDNTDNVLNIKMGVELTLKELNRVFENNKIQEIVTNTRDRLDPNLHQALELEEDANHEPNTIISVLQKGYQLNGRVIRPASVKVSK